MSKKTPDELFAAYGECHQNSINKCIHWICVPTIMLSLLGLLWSIPVPEVISGPAPWLNVATLVVLLCLGYYFWISTPLAIGMTIASAVCLWAIWSYDRSNLGNVAMTSLIVFVLAWIGQFIGHKIEGKKPAFLDDLKFLLIGPVWLLIFIYRKLQIRY